VTGVVTQIRPNEVVVDIGSKHTGIIPAEELSDDSSLKIEDVVAVGDELSLLVINTSDQEGIATLSKKRVDSAEGLEILTQAVEDGTILDAYVTELVNKGMIAVVKGVRVFIPASQATLRRGESYDKLLHTNIKMRILEVNPARRRAIGSIRAVLQDELSEKRDAFWETVEEGKEYTGIVKSLTSYGAFVDLGGVDGMVHISELSWQRIKNPAEIVSVGEEVRVYVREVDRERQRISLGYRKEDDNPWKVLENTYSIGDVFTAPVVSLTKFGAFVRVMPGIDGLVHISEISEDHVDKASDLLAVGDEVMVKLIGVDYDRKRVSLSMKFEGAPVLEPKPRVEEDKPDDVDETDVDEVPAAQQAIGAEEELISPVDEAVGEFEQPDDATVEKAEEFAEEVTESDSEEAENDAEETPETEV
jgi:4-hydroxy-3-methylbut-2-enyl diphosphate reductase